MLQFCVHKITMHKNKRTKKRVPSYISVDIMNLGKNYTSSLYLLRRMDRYRVTLISMKFVAVYTYVHSRHKEDKCIINT